MLVSQGYGYANLEWHPEYLATKFRLGSITKQFTAASILLLEDRGKLSIDDPVKKHLPDAPAAWDQVTIFHVPTHTSVFRALRAFRTTGRQSSCRRRSRRLWRASATSPWSFSR